MEFETLKLFVYLLSMPFTFDDVCGQNTGICPHTPRDDVGFEEILSTKGKKEKQRR